MGIGVNTNGGVRSQSVASFVGVAVLLLVAILYSIVGGIAAAACC